MNFQCFLVLLILINRLILNAQTRQWLIPWLRLHAPMHINADNHRLVSTLFCISGPHILVDFFSSEQLMSLTQMPFSSIYVPVIASLVSCN